MCIFSAEAWPAHEMFSVQDHRAFQLHRHPYGAGSVPVQTHLQGRWGSAVPGADHHPPPLGSPKDGEGKMQTLQQGKRTLSKSSLYFHCNHMSIAVF